MFELNFVRVLIRFYDLQPGSEDVSRILIDRSWSLIEAFDDRIVVLVTVKNSARMSAPSKAERLAEEAFDRFPVVGVDASLNYEESPRPLYNLYRVFKITPGEAKFTDKFKRVLSLDSIGYLRAPIRVEDYDQKLRDLRLETELSQVSGKPPGGEYPLFKYKPVGTAVNSTQQEVISNRVSSRWFMLCLLILLFYSVACGVVFGRIGYGEIKENQWNIVYFLVIPLAFYSVFSVAVLRYFASLMYGSERYVFFFLPLIFAVPAALGMRELEGLSVLQIVTLIVVIVALFLSLIGIVFTLDYERPRIFLLQVPVFLGYLLGGFGVYANYVKQGFSESVGVPLEVLRASPNFQFEVSVTPAIALIFLALTSIGISGWYFYFYGSGEPGWLTVIWITAAYCVIAFVVVLSILINSFDAGRDVRSAVSNGDRMYEYFGMVVSKVCISEKQRGVGSSNLQLDKSAPKWIIGSTDDKYWLYEDEEIRYSLYGPTLGRSLDKSAFSVVPVSNSTRGCYGVG